MQAELPAEMNTYMQFLTHRAGAPIRYISNGPGRDQIIKIEG
jgi:adenylosuccinate synthase